MKTKTLFLIPAPNLLGVDMYSKFAILDVLVKKVERIKLEL